MRHVTLAITLGALVATLALGGCATDGSPSTAKTPTGSKTISIGDFGPGAPPPALDVETFTRPATDDGGCDSLLPSGGGHSQNATPGGDADTIDDPAWLSTFDAAEVCIVVTNHGPVPVGSITVEQATTEGSLEMYLFLDEIPDVLEPGESSIGVAVLPAVNPTCDISTVVHATRVTATGTVTGSGAVVNDTDDWFAVLDHSCDVVEQGYRGGDPAPYSDGATWAGRGEHKVPAPGWMTGKPRSMPENFRGPTCGNSSKPVTTETDSATDEPG